MNFIINTFFLLSIIALGELAYADNKMELTSIVDLLDSSKDVELIRFSCYKKSNQENVCWLLVKVAEIGMLKSRYDVQLLQVTNGSQINRSINMFQEKYKQVRITDFRVKNGFLFIASVLDNKKSLVYRLNQNDARIEEVFNRGLKPNEQSLEFSALSKSMERVYLVSRDFGGQPQLYVELLNKEVVWENKLDFADLQLSLVTGIKELNDNRLVLSGLGRFKGRDRGWVAILNEHGKLLDLVMGSSQQFSLMDSQSKDELGVISEKRKSKENIGLLSNLMRDRDLSSLVGLKMKVGNNTAYLHTCNNQIMALANVKETNRSQAVLISLQLEDKDLVKNGMLKLGEKDYIYRNFNFYTDRTSTYIGSTYIKVMADRKLRVGVRVDIVKNSFKCVV
jgi:hypothetical protein